MTNAEDLAWLETLVWPEHAERRQRLRLAADIAAQDPPRIVTGSLSEDLESLIAAAPADAHVVVFHSAVLVYVDTTEREAFARQMAQRADLTWISNEGVGVLPFITAQVHKRTGGRNILAMDGAAMALTGPHGQPYEEL